MTGPPPAAAAAAAASAAALIASTRLGGELLGDLGENIRPPTELDAYRVQAITRRLLEAAGFGRQSGWKIGCTTKVMQAYLNIDSPCAGTMFQASTWHGRHAFAVPPRGRLGVECEIAVRLARYVDYPSLDTPTLIADDFFHHACVLGPPSESMRPEALRDVTASMTINGVQVGRGTGTDILGEPLQVLCWLANNAAAWGTPLLAGDVILLGSLVQTQWVQAGDAVTVTNDPLGEVAADFTARPG